jgi:hypothetical protein
MEFTEQLNSSKLFKEDHDASCYLDNLLVGYTCDGAHRAALTKLLGWHCALQLSSTWRSEPVALNVSSVTLTHDAVHWTKWTNYRMP